MNGASTTRSFRPAQAPSGPAPVPARSAVAVDAASRAFGALLALDDVSLQVDPGSIHALLGPNGAGKTTLLRILCGLTDPTAGTVRVGGLDPARDRRRLTRVVGFVPSGDRSLYLRISGFENLLFFARLYDLPRRVAALRAGELLELVGLGGDAHRRVAAYSHGMRRRLAVARALIAEPRVLLVDEATHDLDPSGARAVRDLVAASAAAGAAVLWTTQRLDEIRGFAGTATVLVRGRVAFDGSVPELLHRAVPRRFLLRLEPDDGAAAGRPTAALERYGRVEPVPGSGADHVLLALHEHAVLGDALAALAGAGGTLLACSPESSELEAAFVSLVEQDA